MFKGRNLLFGGRITLIKLTFARLPIVTLVDVQKRIERIKSDSLFYFFIFILKLMNMHLASHPHLFPRVACPGS